MSRIVLINGSLRVNGNTYILVQSLLNGAKTRDAKNRNYLNDTYNLGIRLNEMA